VRTIFETSFAVGVVFGSARNSIELSNSKSNEKYLLRRGGFLFGRFRCPSFFRKTQRGIFTHYLTDDQNNQKT